MMKSTTGLTCITPKKVSALKSIPEIGIALKIYLEVKGIERHIDVVQSMNGTEALVVDDMTGIIVVDDMTGILVVDTRTEIIAVDMKGKGADTRDLGERLVCIDFFY